MDAEPPDVAWVAVPSLVSMTVNEARVRATSGVVVTSAGSTRDYVDALPWRTIDV
jgi:hypothetical protein